MYKVHIKAKNEHFIVLSIIKMLKGMNEMQTTNVSQEMLFKMICSLPENKYNVLFEFINSLYAEDYEYDYDPLSDDELEQIEISKREILENNVTLWEAARQQLAGLP